MKVIFESVYKDRFSDYKIIDLVEFKDEVVNWIVEEIEKNKFEYTTLNGNALSFEYLSFKDTIINDEFVDKKIISIDVILNENYEVYNFEETDITADFICMDYECSNGIEDAKRLQNCIEKSKECNYIDNYTFSIDVVVVLE